MIICMSENYEKSNACHHEADYAFVLQRRIIPLVVQSKYKARHWLGFIIASSLYVDFTKYEFDRAYGTLEKEIKATVKSVQQKVTVTTTDQIESRKTVEIKKDSPPPVCSNEKKHVSTAHEIQRIDLWTSDDVISWCDAHHLLTFAQLLEHYDGLSLLRLHDMIKSFVYYKTIAKKSTN